ncbi:MAG: DUF1294 domain-containing protein [Candidatus Methanomethylophilaceae archaeon]|nr:DUF1294 domain-containing protein [Candidatus Methanomethylophilaceae archaeon]
MTITFIALIAYLAVNIMAFVMYVSDKFKAKKKEWRTKESTLLAWSAIGPFGAVAGMQLVRHKTRKLKFKIVYVFLLIHVLILGYIFTHWGFDLGL